MMTEPCGSTFWSNEAVKIEWTRLTLAHDKANHLIYGFVLAVIMTAAAQWAGFAPWAPAIGAAAALVAGAMKELLDRLENQAAQDVGEAHPHSVSLGDVVATAAGGAVHWVVLALGAASP